MQQAIDYEVQWQIDTIENGGKIQQATILFNPDTGETRAMRSKEDAHDYRYFPDPDLLPLDITPEMLEAVRATLPELPVARRGRYTGTHGLTTYDANSLTSSRERPTFSIPASTPSARKIPSCAQTGLLAMPVSIRFLRAVASAPTERANPSQLSGA